MKNELTNQTLPVSDVGTPIALYHIYPPKKAALGRLSLVNDRTELEKANGWVRYVSVLVRQDDAEALMATKDAEIAALRLDALRYRWLRSIGHDQVNVLGHYARDALDAATDKAMAQAAQPT